ncbi:histamine H2 receptor-like [Actinia tenebrosa]|uniref:Histamine H2 receptor-like n=1 Tax=Actinia tenebrosa TaxID=6105 RepID=A0A6P8HTS7_ACTTE|nr:histamine H2 receptor-like [Actinia tenebrosa]
MSEAVNDTRLVECSNISDPWQSVLCTRCGLVLSPDHQELLGIYYKLEPMFGTLAFVLSLLSLIGNFLVILTALADRHNHNMADLFFFNIAIASEFYSGVNIIGESLSLVQGQITLKESCVSQPLTSLRILTFTVSIYSLLAVSMDRYLATTTMFNVSNDNNRKVEILVLLWLISLAITLPIAFCDFTVNIPYTVCLAIIILCLPLLGVLVFNFFICKSARIQVGPMPRHGEIHTQRTVRLVTALVVSLVILWMPYLVMISYPAINGDIFSCDGYIRVLLVERAVNILAYFNAAINPVLYCVFSKTFRQGFQSIHRFSCPCLFEPQ